MWYYTSYLFQRIREFAKMAELDKLFQEGAKTSMDVSKTKQ